MTTSIQHTDSSGRRLLRSFTSPASFALALLAILIFSYPLLFSDNGAKKGFLDITIYYGALTHWRETGDLYNWALPPEELYGFTYPPFAAIAFQPLLLFPTTAAVSYGAFIVNLILEFLVVFVAITKLIASPRLRAALAIWSVPFLFLIFPAKANLGMGQTNMMLLFLILCDIMLLSRTKYSGILAGIAASIKMTPAVLIIFFIARKEWRITARFVGTGIASIIISFLVAPKVSFEYFTQKIFESDRVGSIASPISFSLDSIYHRLFESETTAKVLYIFSVLLVLVAVYFAVRIWSAAHNNLAAVSAVGFAMLLISPISWNHHWVWIIPALIVCLAQVINAGNRQFLFLAILALLIFTMRSDWWFTNAPWADGAWPLHAVLLHALPALWGITFILAPLPQLFGQQKAPADTARA